MSDVEELSARLNNIAMQLEATADVQPTSGTAAVFDRMAKNATLALICAALEGADQ